MISAMHSLDPSTCWQAVQARDPNADGIFVYAVRTTGIYCRPSCPSRIPLQKNICFYPLPAIAEAAGFRPCKRCTPHLTDAPDAAAQLTQAVASYLHAHIEKPEKLVLAALGAAFGYDPQHIQRTFKAVLGLTPRQYAEAVRLDAFKSRLRAGAQVLDAALDSGYGSAGHLYEKTTGQLGMTPSAYRKGGKGMTIRHISVHSDFGVLLLAATSRGICAASLHDTPQEAEEALYNEFPKAEFIAGDEQLHTWGTQILAHITVGEPLDIPLDIQATAFQWKVWQALQAIPRGQTLTYGQLAKTLDMPTGARAVAAACAANRAALIIPCHRVVGSDSSMTGYKWGVDRKQALLSAEREESRLL
jgi:AraC family transcriptional regulator of adaptative response/methylated-DNA-[protein]-cysteine methyltransferase